MYKYGAYKLLKIQLCRFSPMLIYNGCADKPCQFFTIPLRHARLAASCARLPAASPPPIRLRRIAKRAERSVSALLNLSRDG
jgi:hypothetical protein